MATTTRARFLARSAQLFLAVLVITVCPPPAAAQRGAITAPRNLAEMVDEAGLILRGRVVSTQVEPYPQFSALWTVVVTLQVDETLKGQVVETYTFRQFIWDLRDRANAAGYQKGGHLLLLLLSPNQQGFSSPAGLEQGRFRVTTDSAGRSFAINGRNNLGLFSDVASQATAKGIRLAPRTDALVSAPAPGPVVLDDLRDLIRQLVGAN